MSRFTRFTFVAVILAVFLAMARTSVGYAATEGTLNVWCDIRGIKPTDDVYCFVNIDNELQPEGIAPGKKVSLKLAPGNHVVSVGLIGSTAWHWSPDSGITKTVKIGAGYTRSLYATFLRKGKITLTLNQPNALADFYVNGISYTSQVNSVEVLLSPARSHVIEVRSIKDPTLTGDESWKEVRLTTYVAPGAVRTIKFNLQKQYGRGNLNLTCNIQNVPANEALFCLPTIDGVAVEPIPQNGSQTYSLLPGSHTYTIDVGPRSGGWILPTSSNSYPTPVIKRGVTSYQTGKPSLINCEHRWTLYIDRNTCASGPAITANAVIQHFERGIMLLEQDLGYYSILFTGADGFIRGASHPINQLRDTSGSVGTPPPGLYAPTNGFGILWRGDYVATDPAGYRNTLGWALAPEAGYQMTRQCGTSPGTLPVMEVCYLTIPDGRIISFTHISKDWLWAFAN